MKLYKLSIGDKYSEHKGYWFTTRRRSAEAEARKRRKDECEVEIEEIHVELTKAGVLAALNRHATHPDNG